MNFNLEYRLRRTFRPLPARWNDHADRDAMRIAATVHPTSFADDGSIPNNPTLPLVLYRAGIDLSGSPDPEA